jgi:hypothetical protein
MVHLSGHYHSMGFVIFTRPKATRIDESFADGIGGRVVHPDHFTGVADTDIESFGPMLFQLASMRCHRPE